MTAVVATKRQITARNRPLRKMFDDAVTNGVINKSVNWFLHTVLDCCGANEYTTAKRQTFARLLGKCLSSIKNYLRDAVAAGFLWVEEGTHAIYMSALVPPPPIQLSLFDDLPDGQGKNLADQGQLFDPTLKEVNADLNAQVGGGGTHTRTPASGEPPSQPQTQQPQTPRIDRQSRDSSAPAAPLDPAVSEKMALLRSGGLEIVETIGRLARTYSRDRIRQIVQQRLMQADHFGPGMITYALEQNLTQLVASPRRHHEPQQKESRHVSRRATPAASQSPTVAAVVERLAPGVGACRVFDPANADW